MSQRTRSITCLILAAILWSTGGVLIKWVRWNPMALAGARSAIAALTLWIFLRRPRFTGSVAQIGGAVAYAATVLLYVVAVKMTTAANAILLQYTAPVWVALFSAWFLGEKVRRLDWIAVSISLVGMTLFFREGLASPSLVGDLLALLSGVTIAWMTLFLRKQKEGSPLESALLGNILAAAIGLPFVLSGPLPDAQGWLGLLLLGVLQLGLSYVLYAAAIRHVTAFEAILFSTLEPILNPIWVLFLIGERLGPWVLVGGALVVLAITGRGLIVTASTGRRSASTSEPRPQATQ
ncbi:MAG TPA: DMT family transporter [Chloroflexi bacterium]|jgi:drug/metabolite transporter (DMT)-like permease|nr:DMT family transporter [Chloroflexota bacterium]